jgi:hypothetical protein
MRRRRKRLAKSIDHFKKVGKAVHTTQFYDIDWLQGQVKAAVRFAKQVEGSIHLYEEDFEESVKNAVKQALQEEGLSS